MGVLGDRTSETHLFRQCSSASETDVRSELVEFSAVEGSRVRLKVCDPSLFGR